MGCNWCRAFLEELATTPWKRDFRFICVDPSPTRPQLPKWLEKVPTLLIHGEDEPRTDGNVMNWLSEKRLRSNIPSPSTKAGPLGPDEPEGFVSSEMGGKVNGYMYSPVNADTNPMGNGGATITGSFEFLNGNGAQGNRSIQDVGMTRAGTVPSTQQKSKKEAAFDKEMEQYMRNRESSMPTQRPRL
jgi:hypothetical protein